jgi:hypothetical protein
VLSESYEHLFEALLVFEHLYTKTDGDDGWSGAMLGDGLKID